MTDEEGEGVKSKQSKEFSEQGKVKWTVYSEYAQTSNLIAQLYRLDSDKRNCPLPRPKTTTICW